MEAVGRGGGCCIGCHAGMPRAMDIKFAAKKLGEWRVGGLLIEVIEVANKSFLNAIGG